MKCIHLRLPGLLLACAAFGGCASSPPAPPPPDAAAPTPAWRDIVPPEGLPAGIILPREGQDALRAQMTFAEVVDQLPTPEFLREDHIAAPIPATGEALRAAQKAYVHGRDAWHSGAQLTAVSQLQEALALAPDEPHILRLLGRVYSDGYNPTRGAAYLRRALRVDRKDVVSAYLLTRYLRNSGDRGKAIVVGHTALLALDEAQDPAMPVLLRHELGHALLRGGYDAAAVEVLSDFATAFDEFSRTTAFREALFEAYRRQSVTLILVGDALHRLNQPAAALRAYDAVADAGHDRQISLVRRIIYTLLRLQRDADAAARTVAFLRETGADDDARALLQYVADAGVGFQPLADALRQAYIDRNRSTELLLLIEPLLARCDARALLIDHLRARPADSAAFERLVRAHWHGDADATAAVLGCYAHIVKQSPALAVRYAPHLEVVPAEQLNVLPEAQRQLPGVLFLEALGRLLAGQVALAVDAFEKASSGPDEIAGARVEFARRLMDMAHYDRAQAVLGPVAASNEETVALLRGAIFAAQGDHAGAVAVIDAFADTRGMTAGLYLQKARWQLAAGGPAEAEHTFWDGAQAHPTDATFYEELWNLYDAHATLPNTQASVSRLVDAIFEHTPRSPLAQWLTATSLIDRGEADRAEAILRHLVEDAPDRLRPLRTFVWLMMSRDRFSQAERALLQRTRDHPHLSGLRELRSRFYALAAIDTIRSEQFERALNYCRTALKIGVDDPTTFVSLGGRALIGLDEVDELAALRRDASAAYPGAAADIALSQALVLEVAARPREAERILHAAHKRHPDHAALANGLGYTWADAGRHLSEAERLIAFAVDADPDNDAYLDSLAWLRYKQGRFDDALSPIESAVKINKRRDAILLDHYGDVLFRLHRLNDARRVWEEAVRKVGDPGRFAPPARRSLEAQLRAKLDALDTGDPVPVAIVPGDAN